MKKQFVKISVLMIAMLAFGCNDDSGNSTPNAPAIDENKPCDYSVEEQYRKCAEMDGVSVYEYCHPDGIIKSTECDGACTTPKSCKLPNDACAPGSHKCNYGDSLFSEMGVGMVCDNNGVWKKDQDCASGVCNGTRCGKLADTEICKGVTEARCEDNEDGIGILATCTEETRTRTECPNASCKNDKECGTCKSGEVKCENVTDDKGIEVGLIKVCENSEWVESKCKYNRKCASATSCEICEETECVTTPTFPVGDVSYVKLSCPSEAEPVTYSCSIVSCVTATKECGECQNESKRCENHDENGKQVGYISTCEDGQYKKPTRCADDVPCKGNACGDCLNGDTKCEIDNWGGEHAFVYFCVDGSWSSSHDYQCPTAQCTSDNKMCAFTTAQICVQREYGKTGRIITKENNGYSFKDCDDDTSCNPDKTACGECNIGDYDHKSVCVNDAEHHGTWTHCVDGELVSEACKDGNSCSCYNGVCTSCGVCVSGTIESECRENNGISRIDFCEDGKHIRNENCPNGAMCSEDESKCAPCNDGDSYCKTENGKGYLGTCENGEYGNWTECPSGQCHNRTECKAVEE